jgi:ubiquinone biosynthesis protein
MSSRSREIVGTLGRHMAAAAVEGRFKLQAPGRWRTAVARHTRVAFEELGPAFIKLGQVISVRPDVFSSELVFELASLRDAVPPIPFDDVRAVVERDFGRPLGDLFASFDPEPLGSASVAQVHRAVLAKEARPTWGEPLAAGADVAVKVLRPGVREAIHADLEVARGLVRKLKMVGFRRADVGALIDEFETTLARELDLRKEGRTADRFGFDFRDDELVQVPRIVWTRTTRHVLTMEYLEGWRLSDLDQADLAGVDAAGLARHGATAFMRQVLIHGRFHADLHPSNLFVTPDGRIAYLDFGIVGHLDEKERGHIAQLLAALVYGDPERALEHSAGLGVEVPSHQREGVLRDLGELMQRTLRDQPDVRHFGMGFLSLLTDHRIPIPVGYGLLVKSLVTVEGVARMLYPEIDIIETSKPFVTRVLAAEYLRPERLVESVPRAVRAAMRELIA